LSDDNDKEGAAAEDDEEVERAVMEEMHLARIRDGRG
jgi:hypothetical protein